jgi:hypothetical protein
MFLHGAMLGGRHMMPRCVKCEGRSYLPQGERNTHFALAVLAIAFAASYPSPISDAYLKDLSPLWSGMIRVGVWALAVLVAILVFTSTGRLVALPREKAPITIVSVRSLVLEWIFLGFMLWWMYVTYSIAKTIP